MDLLKLPRTALTTSLGAAKWPLDTGLKLAGRNEGPASIALDRADGMVRTVVGSVVRDDVLQQDGVARLTAAEERTKALRLRAEAELRRERADAELDQGREQAGRQRQTAAQRAEEQRRQAEQEKADRKRRAADAERKRKQASRKAENTVEETIEQQAKRQKLETLEQRAKVLDEQDDALTARDEAQRLATAAGAAKAARKNGSG